MNHELMPLRELPENQPRKIKRVGVIGGGQLAWMMAGAAESLGIELVVQTPGTTDPAAANPIELSPGAQIRNIDVTLRRMHTVSVRGRVINEIKAAAGNAAARCTAILTPHSSTIVASVSWMVPRHSGHWRTRKWIPIP